MAEVEQLLAAESSEAALADSLREGLQCSEKSVSAGGRASLRHHVIPTIYIM